MCGHVPWVERTFAFDFPAGQFREQLERMRGCPARVEERTRALPREIRTLRVGGKWSIQERVGHLVDLGGLFAARLDEFAAGAVELRAADLQNRATERSQHNERDLDEILGDPAPRTWLDRGAARRAATRVLRTHGAPSAPRSTDASVRYAAFPVRSRRLSSARIAELIRALT